MRLEFDSSVAPLPPGGDLPASLRVNAGLRLAVSRDEGRLTIAERHESGAFRFRMPRRQPDAIEALLVNVAGGLAGGDRVDLAVEARAGAALVVGSAAAERIYRSGGDTTAMAINLRAEAGARLVWVPAETVIHNGARLVRDFAISLAAGAQVLAGEMLQLGRIASGERFVSGLWHDRWRLRIGGKLVLAEDFHLEGGGPAGEAAGGLAGHAFLATLILAAPEANERLAAIRAALVSEAHVTAGATCHSGLVFARAMSSDDVALRRAFLAALRAAAGADLPLSRLLMLQETTDSRTTNRGLS